MDAQQSWLIQTADLQEGTTLSFDLTDNSGRVLLKAGVPISQRLKDQLQRRNVHTVTVRGATADSAKSESAVLLDSYDRETVTQIQNCIDRTQVAVLNFAQSLQLNDSADSTELVSSVETFVAQANSDVSTALGVLFSQSIDLESETFARLAMRATKLSLMGVITSVCFGCTEQETVNTGLVGLMHDCSLMLHPDWFSSTTPVVRDKKFWTEFRRHPIESAELMHAVTGIEKHVINAMTQVHEQFDGTGFPRGLRGSQTAIEARLLNLADAYLELIDPLLRVGDPVIAADAVAYLCHHASKGKFCKECLLAFVKGLSIYPIGSLVELNDGAKAIVVRSNDGAPLAPVIRLLHGSHEVIDLQNSDRYVTGPIQNQTGGRQCRLPNSKMHEILWRSDLVA